MAAASGYNAFPVNTDESNGVWGNRRYQLKGPCVSSLYSPKEIRTGQSVGKPNRQNILIVSSPFLRRSRKDSSLGCGIAKDVRILFIPARPIVHGSSTRGFFESVLIVFPHCTFWDLIVPANLAEVFDCSSENSFIQAKSNATVSFT